MSSFTDLAERGWLFSHREASVFHERFTYERHELIATKFGYTIFVRGASEDRVFDEALRQSILLDPEGVPPCEDTFLS